MADIQLTPHVDVIVKEPQLSLDEIKWVRADIETVSHIDEHIKRLQSIKLNIII